MSYKVSRLSVNYGSNRNGNARGRLKIFRPGFFFLVLSLFLFSSLWVIGQENACKKCPDGSLIGQNLISNGNFEVGQGSYTLPAAPGNPVLHCDPHMVFGQYCITNNPNFLNMQWITQSQTEGHGYFLVCDGIESQDTKLYETTVSVTPNSDYVFCAWFTNIRRYSGTNPVVQLVINGSPVGSALTLPFNASPYWRPLSMIWNSGVNTAATLKIILVKGNTSAGNDIGMDDISFSKCTPFCSCGNWIKTTITWSAPQLHRPLIINGCDPRLMSLGDVCVCASINLMFDYICRPESPNCKPGYSWKINGPNNFLLNGNTNPCSFIPTIPGQYSITVTPICNGRICNPPCTINLLVKGIVQCIKLIHDGATDISNQEIHTQKN